MNNTLAWDDLRLVLAIADAGTLSGAGRRLGLSHATLFRRLNGVEERLGVRLFDRARSGYSATLAGEEIAETARHVERRVQDVERRIVGRDLKPSGTVRVTTLDSLLIGFLASVFAGFQAAHGEISLEVAVSNQLFSLSKREADVAIRPTLAPDETLFGCKIGTLAFAVYGLRDLACGQGRGSSLAGPWIGPDEAMVYPELVAWMRRQGVDSRCRYRVDSVVGMYAAARAGHGVAVLPCYLGDPDPSLARLGEPVAEMATDLWILTHPDLKNSARVRALTGFVADAVKRRHALLAGST